MAGKTQALAKRVEDNHPNIRSRSDSTVYNPPSVPLQPNTEVLHYRLIEKIGEGGMGVVWRAVDTTLDREVAIKVLPEAMAQDTESLARFEREAKLLASLNHPNIATVHGLHEAEGHRFLAMELVAGEDLAERLERGRPPVDEVTRIALQIALALEVAHDNGVIHRDLKPANVRLTPDGVAKVLDFGLAKAYESGSGASSESSLSPTLTSRGTMEGLILGTASYMSPEQAAGQTVDKRCDVWSFGVVLWEMLVGGRLFRGETVSHTLADVLRQEIDLSEVPADLPPSLAWLLERCLERDAARRLRDIGEARVVLENLIAGRESVVERVSPSATDATEKPTASKLPWVLAGLAGLAAIVGFILLATRPEPPPPPVGRFTITSAVGGATRTGDGRLIAISPNGGLIANTGASAGDDVLYLRPIGSFESNAVHVTAARLPFFSPDGRHLGFVANQGLWTVNLNGGAPVRLGAAEAFPTSVTWSADDYIYIVSGGSISRIAMGGNEVTQVSSADDSSKVFLSVDRLPSGRDLLVTVRDADSGNSWLNTLDPETGELSDIGLEGSDPRYLASGHLLFAAGDRVMAVEFDLDQLKPAGIPVAVLERVGIEGGLMQLSVSDNGTVVYLPEVPGEQSRLVLVDREGLVRPLLANSLPYAFPNDPRFSPDGTKLVNSSALGPIWVLDLESETPTRISEQGFYPQWSRDGSTVYYGTTRGESFDLFERRIDMSAPETMILDRENNLRTGEMAPDGALIFREEIFGKGMDLMRWPDLADPSSIEPLLEGSANELSPAVSPDGRWLAYVSDETGRDDVFVTSYPEPGGHVQISVAGATSPAWSPDSKELFYFEKDRLIAVQIETKPTFRVVNRETLFSGNYSQYRWQRQYDVHPDGDEFVMIESPAGGEVEVVINWFTELERLLPTTAR